MKTIIIAGGTGFLGQILEQHLSQKGYTIKLLTRHPKQKHHIYWNAKDLDEWTEALENCEALINLAGRSVDCRYNDSNKKQIYDSRINSTLILGKAIQSCKHPPKVWLNSSTATIYEHSLNKEMDEVNGDIGDDFSMNIAKSWEDAFNSVTTLKTRKVILRTAIVLGKNGGAFMPLKQLTKLGLGGKQATGNQKISWIHEQDFAAIVSFLITKEHLGVFNVVSPKPVTNNYFMGQLRKALGVPFGISQPKWILKLGAMLIKTETELVLKSRNVIPKRLTDLGFKFQYTNLDKAFNNLIN